MKRKKLWRHIAILLSFCLVFTSMPAMAYGSNEADSESAPKEENQKITYVDPEDITPEDALKDESGLDYTTYSLGGEKKLSVFYTQNVRFEDKEGNLKDYDSSLVTIPQTRQKEAALQEYAYQNKAGDSKQYIPEELSEETPVIMEKDDYSITMTPTEKTYKDFFGKKVKVKREKHKVEDAYNQVKDKNVKASFKEKTALAYVEYTSLPEGVKEDIILTKRPAKNVMQFEITASGLTPKVSELDGSVCFFDKKSGELVNMIDPPNMNDASGKAYSDSLYYEINAKDGEADTYILTLTIDKKYLKAKDRQYPVIIDPTSTWVGDSELRDVYVSSANKTTNYYATARQTMPVGKGSSSTYRTYIKFFSLKSAIDGSLVDSATLKMYETADSNANNTVDAFRVTENWDATTVTWNKQPTTTSSRFGSCVTGGTDKNSCSINATIFARWVANGNSNYGMVLKGNNESLQRFVKFYGSRTTSTSYRPKLSVVYYSKGDLVGTSLSLSNKYIKSGYSLQIRWGFFAPNAVTGVQYKIVNKATGVAVNPAKGYENVTYTESNDDFIFNVPTSGILEDGTYTIYVRSELYNGEYSVAQTDTFYVDNTAPIINSMDRNDDGKGTTISWDITDANFDKAELYLNGEKLYTGTKKGDSFWIHMNYLQIGKNNQLVLKAYDKMGNISSKTMIIKTDSIAPTVDNAYIVTNGNTAKNGWFNLEQPMVQMTGVRDNVVEITKDSISYAIKKAIEDEPSEEEYAAPETCLVSDWMKDDYIVTFSVNEKFKQQGRYKIYVKVKDEAGNATITSIPYNFDKTAPTGRINTKNQMEFSESKDLYGTAYITGIADLDEGSSINSNVMELWKTVDGEEKLVEQVYDNSSGSSSGSNSKAFDTTRFSNGDYILKMTLKDEAGNEKVISKKITIANRIEKPILEAAPSKDGNVKINWQMPDAVKVINGLQYKVEDQEDSTWIKIEGSDTLSGSFIAAVPNQEGSYKVSVRAIDSHGVTGNERTITVRVDKTAPKAEITSVLQGLVKGSVSDTEFLEWKVYVKAKDDADDTYELKLEGTDQKENGLFGSIALYDEKYPAATWYTVKLTATDKAGNQTTVTKDVYKDESSPVPEIVEPDFRIQRPEYQSYTVPQFVLPDTAESLSLTASWPRTFTLGSADWYVNNKKTDTDTATHNLKKSDGSGKYDADTPYMIAAVARGFLGGARYSTTLLKNAQVKDILFKEKTEETISFEEAVGFTLIGGSSDCAYYAKLEGGEYKEITPGETIEISDLNSNQLTADKLTIKADATEGADADAVLLSLDQLEKESFEISGIESYRPDLLSASDKVNYKTYLKWGIPENLPEDISYEVYRSTEAGFDPALSELLTEVRTGYYVEPNVDYATKFYYRVRAVKKDAEGKIVARSSFSDEAASTVVDADEFTKRLGYKEYWDYADFDLPMGSGYIEKSEGNFVYEQTDEELANEHLEVDLTRTYNSMASSKSAFGVGWNHKYDIDLLTTDYSDKLEEGEQLVMKDSSGTLFFFTREPNSAGEYISSMGRYLKLRKLEGTEKNFNVELPDRTAGTESGKITVPVEAAYTVETKENITYWFNQGGQLVYVDEPNGNYLLFEHDINSGLMAKITTSKNLSMTFTYNTQPGTDPTTVKQVTMPDGSSMSYNYASGRLTSAIKTGSAGQGSITYTYGYDGNGKLNSIKDGAGNAYNLTCDNKGRVAKAEYPDGQSINLQRQRSEGQMPKTVTTVTKDGFTMSSETASFDTSSGNCLETVDDDDLITTYVYRDEMLAKTTSQVAYETVENGVMSQKTDTRVTTTEYDNTQNVTREEGGFEQWTELVEYDYDFDGEYDTDFPSHEAEWMDDELVSDVYYDYDEFGNIIREFDEVSDILTEYDYYLDGEEEVDSDFYGEIESETESLNGVVQSTTQYSYHYDTSGNKTETITETVGETTTVTVSKYDVMGRELESTTSVNGQTKSQNVNTFDAFGRVTRSVTTEGSLTTTTVNVYNGNGSVASETTTTSDGNKTESQTVTYEYDNMNRVISQTTTADGKSRPETTTYAYGSIEKNPVLGDTESVYAKITTTISGSVVSKTFTDPKGNVIREDTGGVKTYYAYDASGNQIASATVGDGEAEGEALITANAFDQNGNNTCTMADVVYDSETKTFTAAQDAIITSSVYDGQSRVTRSIDGKGSATTYGYDEQGRMTSITQDADGSPATTKMDYVDPVSGDNTSKTTITLANGSKSRTIVNVEGQTVQESDLGAGSETPINKDYVFTNSGNVLRLTDSAGNYREYEYDPADRQTAVNYFDKNGIQTLRTEFSYDVLGNVTEMRDYRYENGVKTLYRFTERRYDGFGSMTSEAEVDCDGNEPAETELSAMRIAYTYDDDGKLVSTRYPSGFDSNVSGLEYDYGDYSRLMKIKAVTTGGASDLREYAYDAKGNVSSIKDDRTALGGEGHVLKVYGYDHFLRPASITVTDSERDGVAEEYTYAYDKNGQIVTETKLNDYPSSNGEKVDETWAYTFDALGRLTNTTVTDDTSGSVKTQRAYTYDKAGNRLSETENGRTTTNTYNGLNQMLTSGTRSYTYDANGNLIKETGSNGLAKTYSYDADNRLDMAVLAENGTTTLNQKNTYNGEGQRVSKTENDVTTRYSYQGGSVVHTDGSESVKAMNILGESGNIVASERNKEGAKAYYFYNKDMRSSTTSILSGDGNCEAAYQYSDFGETTVNSEFYNEIAYTGGIWDKGTGLYYLNARYYNPDDGRFLTEDTDRGNAENPGTLHLYAYCANNPVNYVDPSGHVFETILDLASVGWSFYEYVKNPSWNNFGWLMWDIGATAVPFVPGSYVKKGTRLAGKVSKSKRAAVPLTQSISSIGRGQHLAIGTYKALSRACRGAANRSSYELHHIIEKRFHYIFRSKTNTWPTALLVKPVHNTITRRYRQAYKYFIGTKKAKEAYYRKVTKTKMIGIVQQVYVDMPSLLLIAVQQVKNDYSNRP